MNKLIHILLLASLSGCANLTPQQSDRLSAIEVALTRAAVDSAVRSLRGFSKDQ